MYMSKKLGHESHWSTQSRNAQLTSHISPGGFHQFIVDLRYVIDDRLVLCGPSHKGPEEWESGRAQGLGEARALLAYPGSDPVLVLRRSVVSPSIPVDM